MAAVGQTLQETLQRFPLTLGETFEEFGIVAVGKRGQIRHEGTAAIRQRECLRAAVVRAGLAHDQRLRDQSVSQLAA